MQTLFVLLSLNVESSAKKSDQMCWKLSKLRSIRRMQMWLLPSLPQIYSSVFNFFARSKFVQTHLFCSSHFRWYWRIYTLIPKIKLLLPGSRMSAVYRWEFWAKVMEVKIRKSALHLILGRTRKVIPPPWYRGGGGGGFMETPSWVFNMLQYFETILPSLESLWSSLQDEVYFMGGVTAWGLWRH